MQRWQKEIAPSSFHVHAKERYEAGLVWDASAAGPPRFRRPHHAINGGLFVSRWIRTVEVKIHV
jgi:hypothetical protein